jgi:hypothetical protein
MIYIITPLTKMAFEHCSYATAQWELLSAFKIFQGSKIETRGVNLNRVNKN